MRWGGTPLRDFLNAVGADPGARYLAVNCGDGYYTSYDLASARHAQTLLCYEAYDRPLALERCTDRLELGLEQDMAGDLRRDWERLLERIGNRRSRDLSALSPNGAE